MKFGGSSVGNVQRIQQVAALIKAKHTETEHIVVVVSAMGDETDRLHEMAAALHECPSPREMDVLLSSGEQVSIALLAIALEKQGIPALSLTGWQAGMVTQGPHQHNRIEGIYPQAILDGLGRNQVVVVAGFQGINQSGEITTLGRGGSDTSAVALAASLGFACEIYTDVNGIYTIDPRVVADAKILDQLTYEETLEMANLGASVIEPRSVELGWRYHVPLWIGLNDGTSKGTVIQDTRPISEQASINNVSIVKEVAYVCVHHPEDGKSIVTLFRNLASHGINVDIISQSDAQHISFTITRSDLPRLHRILEDLKLTDYSVNQSVSKVSVIGEAMRLQPGIAALIFDILLDHQISFYQISTSEISISYLINEIDQQLFVNALYQAFEL